MAYFIKTWKGVIIILSVAIVVAAVLIDVRSIFLADDEMDYVPVIARIYKKVLSDPLPPPPPPSMEKMKTRGCVADGFLTGYGGRTNENAKLINRSECYYLHRAIETWLEPPDFKKVKKIKKKIKKDDIMFGMFIAEAIDVKDNYYYPAEKRDFNFPEVCRKGSKNFWGEHTCKPSFERSEYRKYLRYITEQAIDIGIQSFLFGQIYYQERSDLSDPVIPEIIREMREYADFKGTEIVVGAQTNDISNPEYLKLFDYIEGGVGIDNNGNIENGPCHSRWWQQEGDWCWALLWNEKYASQANNVLLHLDWSAKQGDDMSTFANMSRNTRARTLRDLHKFFTSRNMGFLMPITTPLPKYNNGCHGRKKRFYSPDNKYSCKDENVINEILK